MFVTSPTTSFGIRLHKAKKLSDNTYPIVLQITVNRSVRRNRIGMYATIDQWDFQNHEYRKGIHGRREKNQQLEDIESKAINLYKEQFANKPFNYKKFIELFKNDRVEKMTVTQFCLQVSDKFFKSGQGNSGNDYKYLVNTILKVSPNDLTFEEFTQEWLEEVEEYYTSRGTKCFNHMKHLRALYNKAVKKKLADFRKHPFKNPYTNPYGYEFIHLKKLKSRYGGNRIKDIPLDYMKQILTYEPETENEGKYLDLFFFSYYTFGVNITDFAHLERKHIRNGRWYYERSKTGVGLAKGKPLLPEALAIIEKYDTGKKYVFDILNGYDNDEKQKVNRIQDYAKLITKLCKKASKQLGFDGYFTLYSARHTAATIALNSGADRNTVSHLLDHENFSTIDNYAGRADDDKVVKAMEILRLK